LPFLTLSPKDRQGDLLSSVDILNAVALVSEGRVIGAEKNLPTAVLTLIFVNARMVNTAERPFWQMRTNIFQNTTVVSSHNFQKLFVCWSCLLAHRVSLRKLALQELPGRALGNVINDANCLWTFVISEFLLTVTNQFFFTRFQALF
jgi:hypothetical protein